MFVPLDILLEYWIEHVPLGLLYVMFTFLTWVFYRGVPGFATDCPCSVWCRGWITCPLYVGPLFRNLVENDSRFISLTSGKRFFCCFWLFHILMPYNRILYLRLFYFMSLSLLYFLHSTSVLSFYIDVVLTLSISNMLVFHEISSEL